MAKSRVIITSAGSTFSEWAAYLSDAVVLRHPDHIHAPIRPLMMQSRCYEGPPPGSAPEWKGFCEQTLAPVLCQAALSRPTA